MPLPVRLYNTLTRSIEELHPLTPGTVKLYCCGPTVYNFQHIGNMRTYLFEDLLVRTLRSQGYKVEHVMNITDVGHLVSDADSGEDKMVVAMRREKKRSHEIAAHYTAQFFKDCEALNITRPNTTCAATEHIQEMIALITRLEARGMTYTAGGNVYFDIGRFPEYGKLARLNLCQQEAGARVEVDSHKRHPADFVLWFTRSKFEGQELVWDSPWGVGYPGWHIECSAMAMKYLGEEFDIHCGGIDHIPVHHTNEIAQSEGATGKPWVRIWMHGEFLLNEKREKMAKSADGFITLQDLPTHHIEPMAYRMFCLSAHYRSQLSFSWEALIAAGQTLDRLRRQVLALKELAPIAAPRIENSQVRELQQQFMAAITHDLNAPQALACVWSLLGAREAPAAERLAALYQFDQVLGLGCEGWQAQQEQIPAAILALAEQREQARRDKNYSASDQLRKEILERGYLLEDSPQGPKLRRK